MRNEWIQIVKQQTKDPRFVPKINSKVCSLHFEENCFYENRRRLCLHEGSKPTLFSTTLDTAEQVIEIKIRKRQLI